MNGTIYLVELYPYKRSAASTETVRLANVEFDTEPDDSTLANASFLPVLATPFVMVRSMFSPGENLFSVTVSDRGVLEVANGADPNTGAYPFDYLIDSDYEWSGARAVVKTLVGSTDYGDAVTRFDGFVADEPAINESTLAFPLRTSAYPLEKRFPSTLYAGDNGVSTTAKEGDENLLGKTKPVVIGRVNNLIPPRVNRVGLIYQVHDAATFGAIDEIVAVYDNGVALTYAGDLTGTAFDTWTKVPGSWISDKARGYFMLGGQPFGEVRADVKGVRAQSLGEGSTVWIKAHAEIVYWIADQCGVGSFDDTAFAAHLSADEYQAGLYIDGSYTGLELISRLLPGCGSYVTETRAGELGLFQVVAPAVSEDFTVPDEFIEGDPKRVRRIGPYWRVRIAYGTEGETPDGAVTTGNPTADPNNGSLNTSDLGGADLAARPGGAANAIGNTRSRVDRSATPGFENPLADNGSGTAITNTTDTAPPNGSKIVVATDAGVLSDYPNTATEPEVILSYYADNNGSDYQAGRLLALFDQPRYFYEITQYVSPRPISPEIDQSDLVVGKTALVIHSRFFPSGARLVLSSVSETAESAQAILGYWG